MASKTIMISEKAYEILKKRKKKDESFTDVIIRLCTEKGSIAKLLDLARSSDFEPIEDETASHMRKTSREFRKNLRLGNARLG